MTSFPTPPDVNPSNPNYIENTATGERTHLHTRPDDSETAPLVLDN